MRNASLSFFLFLVLLVSSCVDSSYIATPDEESEVLIYEQFHGYMEMDGSFEFYVGYSNAIELEYDIYVEVGEGKVIFSSLDYEFDLDESHICGANECEIYGAHSSDDATLKRLIFEPGELFWECLDLENCDPDDVLFVFDVFVRIPS